MYSRDDGTEWEGWCQSDDVVVGARDEKEKGELWRRGGKVQGKELEMDHDKPWGRGKTTTWERGRLLGLLGQRLER